VGILVIVPRVGVLQIPFWPHAWGWCCGSSKITQPEAAEPVLD
jgi:hypothetical protein